MRLILVAMAMTWVGCATAGRCEDPQAAARFAAACTQHTTAAFCACAFQELAKDNACSAMGSLTEERELQAFKACRGQT